MVSDAVRRGEDWWLGALPCAYVLVVMVVMYLVTRWRDTELERRASVFLSGLFEGDVVSVG